MTEEDLRKKEQALKPLITDQFLQALIEAARVCGYSVNDYQVVADFVSWCCELVGKHAPDMLSYDATPLVKVPTATRTPHGRPIREGPVDEKDFPYPPEPEL